MRVNQVIEKYDVTQDLPETLTIQTRVELSKKVDFTFSAIFLKYGFTVNGICHIGAHKGDEIEMYTSLGISNLLLIEPLEKNFSVLSERIVGNPHASALKVALGEYIGSTKILLSSNDLQSSSILKPLLHLHEAPDVKFEDEETVSIVTLDSVLPAEHIYNYWVCDVQGYELMALRGAVVSLRKCDYLHVEVNRDETYEDCTQIEDLDDFLLSVGLHRVLTRWWGIWGDAFYIRKTMK